MRFLARDGLNPRFSPDGSQVAFWVGAVNVAASVPGNGTIWVVPVAGGPPRRVGPEFTNARYPIWSPDSRRLLFVGYTSSKAFEGSALDWWLAATDGSRARRTGISDALLRADLHAGGNLSPSTSFLNVPDPSCWIASARAV